MLATAKYRAHFSILRDTLHTYWRELVSYGIHITFAESRVAGRNKFSITKESCSARRNTDQIQYTLRIRDGEFFDKNMSEEELKELFNENNDLQYYTIYMWFLQDSNRRHIKSGY